MKSKVIVFAVLAVLGIAVFIALLVNAANNPPVAMACKVATLEDTPKSITLTASDADKDKLTYSVVANPARGRLAGTAPDLTYTPETNFSGSDSFSFKVNDGEVDSNTVTVSIEVESVNDTPKANNGSIETAEDTPKSITLTGSDDEGDQLTYSVIATPAHGRLSGTAPNLTYNPEKNFSGSDSFSFRVNDGEADSDAATVSIAVESVNDMPKADDDSVKVQEDDPIATVKVLANDTDPDNDKLVVVDATQGTNGSVTIGTDSTLTYAPARNFSGTDTFTYTISDGKGGTDTATVNVTIIPVNDAPSITSKPSDTTRVWASYTYDVDAKDSDPEDSLAYSLTEKPEGMSIDKATGLIEWRPTSAQAGDYDVTVRVADNNKISAWDTQSFTITVTSLSSPLTTRLAVAKCFSQKGQKTLSARDKISVVGAGDDSRVETEPHTYTCYEFEDASIPAGASIVSIIVNVEHFEEKSFRTGKLQWSVGTGWPDKPVIWTSIEAPVRQGPDSEARDSWDVTGSVDTPEKANSLRLQIKNDDPAGRKTSADWVYAIVKWY